MKANWQRKSGHRRNIFLGVCGSIQAKMGQKRLKIHSITLTYFQLMELHGITLRLMQFPFSEHPIDPDHFCAVVVCAQLCTPRCGKLMVFSSVMLGSLVQLTEELLSYRLGPAGYWKLAWRVLGWFMLMQFRNVPVEHLSPLCNINFQ